MRRNPWLSASPTVGGLPLWAQSPEAVVAPRPQISDDALLDNALLNRYEGDKPLPALDHFRQEIGVDPAVVQPVEDLQNEQGKALYGRWSPEQNRIEIEANAPKAIKMGAIAHEYAHKADDYSDASMRYNDPLRDEFPSGGNVSPSHHRDFLRFEPQMGQSIDAQRGIENGWPVNPEIIDQYPWLARVRAQSSNPLANPWVK